VLEVNELNKFKANRKPHTSEQKQINKDLPLPPQYIVYKTDDLIRQLYVF